MSVRIITDSTSDITQAEARALNIDVVPLKVIFNGVEYKDGVDITNPVFYEKLAQAKELPTTTQPSTQEFREVYEAAPENTLVVVTVAACLSGTAQSAAIAAEGLPGKEVYLVDSESATLGLNILVRRAVQLRDQGLDGASIARHLEAEKKDLVLLASVDTLTYLHKGGRLSKTAALAGGLLGIKPILTLQDGAIQVLGKERGTARACKFILDTATGMGLPDPDRPSALGYTAVPDNMEALRKALGTAFCPQDILVDSIGSTIGTHVGPGAAAIVYFKKNQS